MLGAIVASTLTSICVFAPMLMFQGLLEMAGELFAGIAFTIVISLGISLLVAAVLVPVLSSHYLPLVTRKQKQLRNPFLKKIDGAAEGFLEWLNEKYRHAVDWALRHKKIVVFSIMVLFIGSIVMIPTVIGWQFMPAEEADNVTISVSMPLGTPLKETEATLRQIQTIVEREVQGYERLVLNTGGGGMMGMGGSNSNQGSLRINLPAFDERIDRENDIKTKMRKHFNEFPGVRISFGGGGMGGGMMGGGDPIDIVLHVEDLVKGKAVAERIAELIRTRVPDATEPTVDLNDGLPQIEIELDRDRIYALGLNAYTIGNELKAAVDGVTATKYKNNGNDYDVVLILAEADRSSLPNLDQIFVNSATAGRVPLSSFASYKKGTGALTIKRENQSRVIHINAGKKDPKVRDNMLEDEVRALITAEIPQEDDIIIEYAGGNSSMMKMMKNFLFIVIIAIFLVFGIMASIFESFRDPFIIIFTIPLSIIGIVFIYFVTGDMFNVLTAVGLLVLVGVIVNNGIVLVDYTNLLRKRGVPLHEACIQAAGNRLRPILMSTLTTVLGLVPMAFSPGEGSQMTAPIGKTVLGGLTFGTLMTLFLMPVLYAIINKKSDMRAARAEERRQRIASGLSARVKKEKPAKPSRVESLSSAPDAEPRSVS
jgi:HAE1 family hydrophobic/amphiphilic exporter-1